MAIGGAYDERPPPFVAQLDGGAEGSFYQEIIDHFYYAQLRAQGVRAELDVSDERFPKKIRTASKEKVPFVLIAGGEDAEAGAVSFRYRDGSQDNQIPVADAVKRIVEAIRTRAQV